MKKYQIITMINNKEFEPFTFNSKNKKTLKKELFNFYSKIKNININDNFLILFKEIKKDGVLNEQYEIL